MSGPAAVEPRRLYHFLQCVLANAVINLRHSVRPAIAFVFTSLSFPVIKRGNGPGSTTPFVSSRVMFSYSEFGNDNRRSRVCVSLRENVVWHETLNITVKKKHNNSQGEGKKRKNIGATRI